MPKVSAVKETDVAPGMIAKFLQKRRKDPFWKKIARVAEPPWSENGEDRYVFVVRSSVLHGVLHRQWKAIVLFPAHYRRLAGHPGGLRLYYTL